MTQDEKKALRQITEALEAVQEHAPEKTSYVKGRADRSMAYQLLDIIRDLKNLVGDDEPEPAA